MDKFYPDSDSTKLCVSCYYARPRKDICGVYCTTGFAKDGKCEKYRNYREEKKLRRKHGRD